MVSMEVEFENTNNSPKFVQEYPQLCFAPTTPTISSVALQRSVCSTCQDVMRLLLVAESLHQRAQPV